MFESNTKFDLHIVLTESVSPTYKLQDELRFTYKENHRSVSKLRITFDLEVHACACWGRVLMLTSKQLQSSDGHSENDSLSSHHKTKW